MFLGLKAFYSGIGVLRFMGVPVLYHKLMRFRELKKYKPTQGHKYRIIDEESHPGNEERIEVEIDDQQYTFLKRAAYDFLYQLNKPIKGLRVFGYMDKQRHFVLRYDQRERIVVFD